MLNKCFVVLVLLTGVAACTSKYAPLPTKSEHAGGYQERLLTPRVASGFKENTPDSVKSAVRYYLIYKGTTRDSKTIITQYWHQRASELCSNGYRVVSHKQGIIYGTVETPVNGRVEKLGTQKTIDRGVIECLP